MKPAENKVPVPVAIKFKITEPEEDKSPEFSNPLPRDRAAADLRLPSAEVWISPQGTGKKEQGQRAAISALESLQAAAPSRTHYTR